MSSISRAACLLALVFAVVNLAAPLHAQGGESATEREVLAFIENHEQSVRETNKTHPDSIGDYLFASNGALLERSSPGATRDFDWIDVNSKYVRVLPLVEGRAAVSMGYVEGRMKLKGGPAVNNYRTRCSRTFVKQDGKWRCVTEHFSPLVGGAGVGVGGVVNTNDASDDSSKVRASSAPAKGSMVRMPPETDTVREIRGMIVRDFARVRNQKRTRPGEDGQLVFHSSGGFIAEYQPTHVNEFDVHNIKPHHITVVPLVEGEAAVALFYATGSVKMKGLTLAPNYRVRASVTFAKKFGQWRRVSAHWSPMQGAEGMNPQPDPNFKEEVPESLEAFSRSHPSIDVVTRAVDLYVAGDIDGWRSAFTWGANFNHNSWGTGSQPIDELAKIHKAFHENIKSVRLGRRNFEVVTLGNGSRHVHGWLQFLTEYKDGQKDERIVFGSWGVNDNNKIWYEWAIYDSANMPKLSPYGK